MTDAEAAAARSRETARETPAPPALAESALVRLLSVIRLLQGRRHEHEHEQARSAMARDLINLPPTFFVVRAHAGRERDDREAAREAFERALAVGLLEIPRGPTWTMTLTWAADICAWLGDCSTAMPLLELLTPFAGVMTWQYGPVGRAVGLLELTLGRRSEAERRLREAIVLCERMDGRAFLAMARLDLGALLHPRSRAAGCSTRRSPPPTSSA